MRKDSRKKRASLLGFVVIRPNQDATVQSINLEMANMVYADSGFEFEHFDLRHASLFDPRENKD